jgi:hypothetical protein
LLAIVLDHQDRLSASERQRGRAQGGNRRSADTITVDGASQATSSVAGGNEARNSAADSAIKVLRSVGLRWESRRRPKVKI